MSSDFPPNNSEAIIFDGLKTTHIVVLDRVHEFNSP
jgi:hypothetical protein